ncbi:peptidoglycan domain protein [Salmonella phage SPAsTU]|nr:glycosyl hydrolase 108 [Salmonella phage STsAS]AWN09175.2 peptidoglycan domain protein [Salmonella phage SPAsTU]
MTLSTQEVIVVDRWSKEGIIRAKVNIEAGYTNNPNDLGKETIWGVTKATADEYGYKGAMKDMPQSTAFAIYDKLWWQRMRLDQIMAVSPALADRMFDFGINAGRANCIRELQRILNVLNRQQKLYGDIDADGGIGTLTLTALNGFIKARGAEGVKRLVFALGCHQCYYYTDISEKREKNEEFTYGWYDRIYQELPDYAVKLGICK